MKRQWRMLEKYALVSTTLKVFFQRLKMENIHVLITTGCANIGRVVFFFYVLLELLQEMLCHLIRQ